MKTKTVKANFWLIALIVMLVQIGLLVGEKYKIAAWFGIGFQTSCLVFMREDVK